MAASPRMQKALWRVWYQFLARRFRQDDWTFMNYGFCGDDSNKLSGTLTITHGKAELVVLGSFGHEPVGSSAMRPGM